MKVKLLVARCGPRLNQIPGQEIDVEPAEARRMFDAGQCVLLEDFPPEPKPEPERPDEGSTPESTETKKPAKAASKSKAAAVKSETDAPTS